MKSRSATEQAIGYLARREHSAAELQQKLQQAGHETDKIHAALEKLQHSGLQNDERFAEAFIRSRALRGYGELRIRQEMKQKGVGEQSPDDFKDRAKQMRFLQYRGFTHEQITESFKLTNENER